MFKRILKFEGVYISSCNAKFQIKQTMQKIFFLKIRIFTLKKKNYLVGIHYLGSKYIQSSIRKLRVVPEIQAL